MPVKLTLLVISTLTVMAGATIAPSLPAMQEFFAEVPRVEVLVRLALTLPALLIAISAPGVGVAIDRLGRKPLLLGALVLYGVAGSSGFLLNTLSGITTCLFLDQFLSPLLSQPLSAAVGLLSTYGLAAVVMLILTLAAGILNGLWK